MVNTVLGGSHGRIMADVRRAAEAAGMGVAIAYGRGGAPEDTACRRIDFKADVLTHVALTRLLDRHARGSRRATRAVVDWLRAFGPDLLHLHNLHGYYLHAETFFDFVRQSGMPIVWTLHDCWAFTGHCSHYSRVRCDRWQAGCHDCPMKREYPASLLLDASRGNWRWKRAAFSGLPNLTMVSPAKWLADDLGRSFLQDAPREVIPNGVDLSLFQPSGAVDETRAHYGVKPGQRLLLAVAAPFDARKGYKDALQVAETLGDAARLVLVGLTEKQTRDLPANVTGLLRTDGLEALVALYGAADCLINPTYEDTYPTVNMEAMACGTPVAAYDTGGCAEQLVPSVGAVVPAGDARGLADAAMALAGRTESLRQVCREHAERNFDRRRAVEQYLALYRRLMGA